MSRRRCLSTGASAGAVEPEQNFLQLRQRLDRVDKHTYLTESIVTPPGSIQEEAWLAGAQRLVTADLKAQLIAAACWRKLPAEANPPFFFDLGLAAYLINPEESDYGWPRLAVRWGIPLREGQGGNGPASMPLPPAQGSGCCAIIRTSNACCRAIQLRAGSAGARTQKGCQFCANRQPLILILQGWTSVRPTGCALPDLRRSFVWPCLAG